MEKFIVSSKSNFTKVALYFASLSIMFAFSCNSNKKISKNQVLICKDSCYKEMNSRFMIDSMLAIHLKSYTYFTLTMCERIRILDSLIACDEVKGKIKGIGNNTLATWIARDINQYSGVKLPGRVQTPGRIYTIEEYLEFKKKLMKMYNCK